MLMNIRNIMSREESKLEQNLQHTILFFTIHNNVAFCLEIQILC